MVERSLSKREVPGSIPGTSIYFGYSSLFKVIALMSVIFYGLSFTVDTGYIVV